jgi:acetolactate synthase-1/2/3 large subunit
MSIMVVISGQVSSAVIGNDAFQEVDAVGITRSCVKHNFLVKDTNDLATIVKKAFHIATTGRPGPVLIDITKDTTITEIEFDGYPKSINMRSYQPEIKVDAGQIDRAVALITQAKKPIIAYHCRGHLTRNNHHRNRIHMCCSNTCYTGA